MDKDSREAIIAELAALPVLCIYGSRGPMFIGDMTDDELRSVRDAVRLSDARKGKNESSSFSDWYSKSVCGSEP